jgi:hypothetical protein
VNGSSGEVVLFDAFPEATSGGNAIYTQGAGSVAALYNTNGAFDALAGPIAKPC